MEGHSNKYDEEFQRRAVDYQIQNRKSVRQAAIDLGISEHSIRNWKKKFLSESESPQGRTLEEENERMKAEIAELKEEREILKKSVAIFLKPRR